MRLHRGLTAGMRDTKTNRIKSDFVEMKPIFCQCSDSEKGVRGEKCGSSQGSDCKVTWNNMEPEMETFYKKSAAARRWKVFQCSQNAPLFIICSFWGAWDHLLAGLTLRKHNTHHAVQNHLFISRILQESLLFTCKLFPSSCFDGRVCYRCILCCCSHLI